jgi:hypothetical protein
MTAMQDENTGQAGPPRRNKAFLAALIVLVIVAGAFVYYYSSATGQISDRDSQIADYLTQTQTLKGQLSTATGQVSSLQTQVSTTQGQLTSANTQVTSLQGQLTSANGMTTTVQARLDKILDTQVGEYYTVTNLYQYYWQISIPLRTYFYYKEMPRALDSKKYSTILADAKGNSIMDSLVSQIRNAALSYNLKPSDQVNLIASFSQSLVHGNKDIATPYDDYPCYPVETLFQQGGDSEDNSILAAAILTRLDYNVVFFVFDEPKHVAVGVDFPTSLGLSGWEYQGKKYVYLETTGQKWQLGQGPTVYTSARPTIVPVTK